jgi:sterol desaturase/sphingolipid hydroxylase (fatty acid hydroxylase superfamily)
VLATFTVGSRLDVHSHTFVIATASMALFAQLTTWAAGSGQLSRVKCLAFQPANLMGFSTLKCIVYVEASMTSNQRTW